MTSREKEIIARKVKITMGCTWKTIWKGEKTAGEQGWISLALSSFVLRKNGGLPYTVMIFSLRKDLFSTSLPYKLSTIFFIVLSLVLTLIVQQHVSSYNPRNVVGYRTSVTLWFPHLNPNTANILCSGWRRENDHVKVSIVEWKVTLPLHGGQSLDKERDIKGLESNAHVPNSSPAQA